MGNIYFNDLIFKNKKKKTVLNLQIYIFMQIKESLCKFLQNVPTGVSANRTLPNVPNSYWNTNTQ